MTQPADLVQTLRSRLGPQAEELVVPGNRPVVLGDVSCVWITLSGKLELFSMRVVDDQLLGARHHFATCVPGQLVLARDYARRGEDSVLIGVGDQDTRVLCIPARALVDLLRDPQHWGAVVTLFDRWITTLAQATTSERRPRAFHDVRWGSTLRVEGHAPLGCSDGVAWIGMSGSELSLSGNRADVRPPSYVPLTPFSWVEVQDREITAHATADLLRADPFGQRFLVDFYEYAVRLSLVTQAEQRDRRRLDDFRAMESDASELASSLAELAHVGVPDSAGRILGLKAPTLATMEAIADHLGLTLGDVPERVLEEEARVQVESLARILRVRIRKVTLERTLEAQSTGPLLAYLRVGERARPIALLPEPRGGYRLFDPADGKTRVFERSGEIDFEPIAFQFYRALPSRPVSLWEVMKFGARDLGHDVALIVGVGAVAGLLGLVSPMLMGQVYDSLIPEAERGLLMQLMLVAVGLAFGGGLFSLASALVLVRVEARIDTSLQPAVWDRLLSLPLPFFRQFSAGDLAMRAEGIDQIRQVLSGGALSAVLSAVFSLWNLILLFHYDTSLAVAGLLLAFLTAAGATATTLTALSYQRRIVETSGKLEGLLLQILTGIAKLRVSGTEGRAFRVWARLFEIKRDGEQRAVRAHNRFRALHVAYPLVSSAILFSLVMRPESAAISTGEFLAFSAAFGTLTGALLHLVDASLSALSIIPLYERAKPILEATPEVDELKSSPGELSGAIEVNQVSFRYEAGGAPILDEVSLSIDAGEFVGLVGPSGSGKSTLLRMMLGLDTPDSGSVYYDGRALGGLDTREVRRQIGTVMQSSQLMEGDIYQNIVGSTGLSLDDAKRAAEQAGLTEDIAALPMGMHTLVNQGGGTFSGGQRQRLLIARALVASPRLLFFDEATSALDNRTQEHVSAALEKLNVTRVVVAHRLSTIRKADRIFVLERGKVVESGTYDQLMQLNGTFTRLAKRQLL